MTRPRMRQATLGFAETAFALVVQDAPQAPARESEAPAVDERQIDWTVVDTDSETR